MPTPQPTPRREFALEVVRELRRAGYQALWAGGCVRDQLLGREPVDFDVATNATPEEIRAVFGRRRTLAIGASFGVMSVLGPREAGQIDVATFRRDAAYSDGRHPDRVTFSTAEADAQRRDFTINGLFYDPHDDRVLDFVGGREDLRRGIVRAIGDPEARIAEDKLRMLRAVRFAATFRFEIDAATFAAVQRNAHEIVIVSAERIAAELRRMLTHAERVRAVELLQAAGLLEVILPETKRLEPGYSAGGPEITPWRRTLAVLAALEQPCLATGLAALLRETARSTDEAPALGRGVGQRLRLATDEIDALGHMLGNEAALRRARAMPWPALQRLLVAAHSAPLVHFAAAVAAATGEGTEEVRFARERLAWPAERLNPPPLVTGADLIAAGLQPGPHFRRLLETLRDRQLLGELTTKSEALAALASLRKESP